MTLNKHTGEEVSTQKVEDFDGRLAMGQWDENQFGLAFIRALEGLQEHGLGLVRVVASRAGDEVHRQVLGAVGDHRGLAAAFGSYQANVAVPVVAI